MTVPIDVPAALIFVASCVVGYAVYRHTRTTATATATATAIPQAGDLGTAFAAGLVALTALNFLFGVTTERPATAPDRKSSVVESSTPPVTPTQPVSEAGGSPFPSESGSR